MINFVELKSNDYAQGVILVFFAGVLWSTVGLGIRLIENAFKNVKFISFCSLYTLITSNSPKAVITKLKRLKMGLV